jgi:hypothetical protein
MENDKKLECFDVAAALETGRGLESGFPSLLGYLSKSLAQWDLGLLLGE